MVQQPNLRITEEKDCRLSSDKSDQGKQSAKALCLELTVIWSLRQHETFILGSLISSDQALAVWGLQQATTAAHDLQAHAEFCRFRVLKTQFAAFVLVYLASPCLSAQIPNQRTSRLPVIAV